ncbi:hypothetical protein GA0115240_15908 [Streptomyces sp. DvalAA-14]|nr:hypothetical protein GA0115240_15908 [Streptomyces sp. DvalAA-14]
MCGPPAAYFDEKARTPLRSMTIVDLKFHAGEVFVAGGRPIACAA